VAEREYNSFVAGFSPFLKHIKNSSSLIQIYHFHHTTMTSSEVAQKPAKAQQVAANQQSQYAREEKEQSASASASAGVCLKSSGV
jgi:predicted glycosyltransferase involved in capsule biosynthesis